MLTAWTALRWRDLGALSAEERGEGFEEESEECPWKWCMWAACPALESISTVIIGGCYSG